jgi:hypothetical protein
MLYFRGILQGVAVVIIHAAPLPPSCLQVRHTYPLKHLLELHVKPAAGSEDGTQEGGISVSRRPVLGKSSDFRAHNPEAYMHVSSCPAFTV